jgi:hypothetical protein
VPQPTTTDVTQFVDVYFHETPPLDNEQMNGMLFVAYLTPGPGVGPTGVHFGAFDAAGSVPGANHPYIFPGQPYTNYGSDALHYKVGADAPPGNVNVTDGQGVVRIPVVIPAGTPVGNYAIKIDDDPNTPGEAGFTSFGTADIVTYPDTAAYPFTSQDGALTVTAVPEPATLGLFSIAAVGLLARRRKA